MKHTLYMVVRVTSVETCQILYIANLENATLLGQLYMAEHPGQKCIAPPLEARGFSKLDLNYLQYLLWNSFGLTPPEDFQSLHKICLDNALKIPVTEANPASLRSSLSHYEMETVITDKGEIAVQAKTEKVNPEVKRKPRPEGTANTERPRENSTSALIWSIADKHFENVKDLKTLRKLVMDNCEKEGVNLSTVSVQFGKWKVYQNV